MCVGGEKCMGRREGKRPLERHRHGCEAVEWIYLVQKWLP